MRGMTAKRNRTGNIPDSRTQKSRPLALILILCLTGCASYQYDLYAKPKHREESAFVNWFKNTFIFQVQQGFDLARDIRVIANCRKEASNLDENGNPPDSPLYTNRDTRFLTLDEIARGPNTEEPPRNPFTITKLKESGSPGFFGKDSLGRGYLVKFDPPEYPELATGAEIVGNRIVHALGYNVPQAWISQVEGTGDERFDGRRAMATRLVEGENLGFWRASPFRHRREVRAIGLVYAFINNTDAKETNTLVVWQDGKPVYYLIDFGSSLGSATFGPKEPKQGWENLWDFKVAVGNILTLGLGALRKPYDRHAAIFSNAVGLFDGRLNPRGWKPNYPNIAFEDMTEEDGRWMAAKIFALSDEQIRSVVKAAQYTRREDEDYIVRVLIARRNVIGRAYGIGLRKVAASNRRSE